MSKTLHIANGDSTRHQLEKSGLQGDIVVCREVLCEGNIVEDVGSDLFWQSRYTFFKNECGVDKLEYFDKTIKEFVQLQDVSEYGEVVLWFEYDLFCQVNLMAICTYLLKHYKSAVWYYLVCVGKEHPKNDWKTLSDYRPEEFVQLYENKTKLSRNDLQFAKATWEVYVRNNKEEIKTFNYNQGKKIKYFEVAMQQHLKRFKNEKGFNEIDYKILEIIKSHALTEREIVKKLLIWQRQETVYGLGDLQYFNKLKKLSNYYMVKDGLFYLNIKGKEVLN